MDSAWLLLLIFSIWALLVIPLWIREARSHTVEQVRTFRSAMETLREGQLVPDQKPGPQVLGKVSPRAGYVQKLQQRYLRNRRIGFGVAVVTYPIALILQIVQSTGPTIWVLPGLATATFVVYARYTVTKVQRARRANSREAVLQPRANQQASKRSTSSQSSGALASGLSAIRKIAARRLVASTPQVETEKTSSWQPSPTAGSPWVAPDPVLPAYVARAAAAEAAVEAAVEAAAPVEVVESVVVSAQVSANWDRAAMLEAVRAQQSMETIAALVAKMQAAEQVQVKANPNDDTAELTRIVGA